MTLLGPIGPQAPKGLYAVLAIVLCRIKDVKAEAQSVQVVINHAHRAEAASHLFVFEHTFDFAQLL
jgi:hypothetical protein